MCETRMPMVTAFASAQTVERWETAAAHQTAEGRAACPGERLIEAARVRLRRSRRQSHGENPESAATFSRRRGSERNRLPSLRGLDTMGSANLLPPRRCLLENA